MRTPSDSSALAVAAQRSNIFAAPDTGREPHQDNPARGSRGVFASAGAATTEELPTVPLGGTGWHAASHRWRRERALAIPARGRGRRTAVCGLAAVLFGLLALTLERPGEDPSPAHRNALPAVHGPAAAGRPAGAVGFERPRSRRAREPRSPRSERSRLRRARKPDSPPAGRIRRPAPRPRRATVSPKRRRPPAPPPVPLPTRRQPVPSPAPQIPRAPALPAPVPAGAPPEFM